MVVIPESVLEANRLPILSSGTRRDSPASKECPSPIPHSLANSSKIFASPLRWFPPTVTNLLAGANIGDQLLDRKIQKGFDEHMPSVHHLLELAPTSRP